MDVEVERLKAARKVLVRIVQTRQDGAKFLPVIIALERKITAMTDLCDDLARIMSEGA